MEMPVGESVRILSADAPKGGLRKNSELFSAETGISHEIELATGPVIKQRVLSGNASADLIVIPRAEFDDLISAGHFNASDVQVLGHVTVGVTIRNGAREPDLTSVDGFIKSVLAADRIIYNTASSGQYVAKMFERLNLLDKIKDKTSIMPTGKTAMEELAADKSGGAIGFGHVTEIRLHDKLGTHLVGPLPREIGRQTPYAVGLWAKASQPVGAQRLAEFLLSTRGRDVFRDAGVI
jgi:molybdate transport system substrate-binding protein